MLGAALRDLRHTGAGGVSGILVTGLAVLVTGGALLGVEALGQRVAAWRAALTIVAVLREEAPRPAGLLATVRALSGVGAARYVSSGEALGELRRYLGAAGAGLERLPANPVPARLVVTPVDGLDAAGINGLVTALRRLPGVEGTEAATGWVEPSERLARGLRTGGLLLGGLLGVAAALAIAGASQRARRGRADETAILRQAGVPEARLRGPLVLQSVVLGAAGAALGWSALCLLTEAAAPWAGAWVRAVLGLPPLPIPDWPLSAGLLGGGLAAGLAGGLGGGRP